MLLPSVTILLGYIVGIALGVAFYVESFIVFLICTGIAVVFDITIIVSFLRALKFYRSADPRLENTLMYKYIVETHASISDYYLMTLLFLIPYIPIIFVIATLIVYISQKAFEKLAKFPKEYFRKIDLEREQNLHK